MVDNKNNINDDLQESVDLSSQFSSAFERVRATIHRTSVDVLDLNTYLKSTILYSDQLPKKFTTVEKLQKAMLKDAKVFAIVQKSIQKDVNGILKGYSKQYVEKLKELKLQKASKEEIADFKKNFLEKRKNIESDIKKDLESQVDFLKRQQEESKKLKATYFDTVKILDDLGQSLVHPGDLLKNMVAKASSFPVDLFEKAKKESMGLGEALKAKVGEGFNVILQSAKMLFSPTGLLIVGLSAATAATYVLLKGITSYFSFINDKAIPAQADFNKQLGSTGANSGILRGQMVEVGKQFDKMGLGFEAGTSAFRDFIEGLRTDDLGKTEQEIKKNVDVGLKLVSVYGLSGEAAGKLANQFIKSEGSLQGLNKMMQSAEKAAEDFHVPTSQIVKDMANAPEVMARFGASSRVQFPQATAIANKFGVSIKTINSAFGKTLDTFEGSSDAAAKLNAAFGTNINSMQLMLEQDPTKRFQMIRKQLLDQHKSWDKLNVSEKNLITTSLHLDDTEASLLLTQNKGLGALKKYQKEKEDNLKTDKLWDRGIYSIKRNIVDLEKEFEYLLQSVGKFAMQLLGIPTKGADLKKWGQSLGASFHKMADNLDMVKPDVIFNLKDAFMGLPNFIKSIPSTIDSFSDSLKNLATVVGIVGTAFSSMNPYLKTFLIAAQTLKAVYDFSEKHSFGEKLYDWMHPEEQTAQQTTVTKPEMTAANIAANNAKQTNAQQTNFDFKNQKAFSKQDIIQINLMLDSKKVAEQMVQLQR